MCAGIIDLNRPTDGLYAVLQVRVPGDRLRRAGLLLIDGEDQVYLRVSENLFTAEPDVLEYWAAFADDVSAMGRELGGRALLAMLEDTASNFLVVETVGNLVVEDPSLDAERLFSSLILRPESGKAQSRFDELKIERYSAQEIGRAQNQLPQTPAAGMRIWQFHQRRNSSVEELEKLLNGDPTLTAQIIKLSNMVAYSRGGEIRTLKRALLQIGSQAALAFLMGITMRSAFSTPYLEGVWNRSMLCSQALLRLGPRCGFGGRSEELSLLGCVMNIGKIVLANLPGYPTRFADVRALGYSSEDCEAILCGSTHAEIGARLLQDWSFPGDLAEAVKYHHEPSKTEGREAALLFVTECWFGGLHEAYSVDEERVALDRLGLSFTDLVGLDEDLDSLHRALCFSDVLK